ncbi:MAG: helix-turn-helix domain-containing protein [Ethanoligenens sp.]
MDLEKVRAATIHPQCPVETSLSVIGGKWKGIILFRLLDGTKRFSELKRLIPAITHRTLTLQLRELEKDGLVSRKVYPEIPPRVEYSLTPCGVSIRPVINALQEWGAAYRDLRQTT